MPALTADERMDFVRAILETFASVHKVRRNCVSPAEYDLARKWATKRVPVGELGQHEFVQVPLATVLQGIHETTGRPRTLFACERAVEENVSRWVQALGGLTELPKAGPLEVP